MTREEFEYSIKSCGFLIHQGQTYYEESELIKTFEDMGLIEQEPSGDLIRRQAVIDACEQSINILEAVDRIMDLPSVKQEPCSNCCNGNQIEKAELCQKSYLAGMEHKQEPKTGHWIKSNIPNEEYVCSECGGGCWYYDYQADVAKSRYCPNCGCRMVEPQERSDKE